MTRSKSRPDLGGAAAGRRPRHDEQRDECRGQQDEGVLGRRLSVVAAGPARRAWRGRSRAPTACRRASTAVRMEEMAVMAVVMTPPWKGSRWRGRITGHDPAASTGRRARPARWRGARTTATCRGRAGTTAGQAAGGPPPHRPAVGRREPHWPVARAREPAALRRGPRRRRQRPTPGPASPAWRGSSASASANLRPRCSCNSTAANASPHGGRRAPSELVDGLRRRPRRRGRTARRARWRPACLRDLASTTSDQRPPAQRHHGEYRRRR